MITVVDIRCRCHDSVLMTEVPIATAEANMASLIEDRPRDEFPSGLVASEPYEIDDPA